MAKKTLRKEQTKIISEPHNIGGAQLKKGDSSATLTKSEHIQSFGQEDTKQISNFESQEALNDVEIPQLRDS